VIGKSGFEQIEANLSEKSVLKTRCQFLIRISTWFPNDLFKKTISFNSPGWKRGQFFQQALQAQELLVLLQEHGEQEGLEGEGVGGVGGGGQVLVGGGEEVIQGELVAAAQGAAEAAEGLLLEQEGLGDGGEGAAHGSEE
jgi:hypothetical protein